MEWRSEEDLRASFARVSATLDEAVRLAQHDLGDPSAQVRDDSNRSGFDKAPTWYFLYDVRLEFRHASESIERASARLTFFEPPLQGDPAEVQLEGLAERFYPGASTSLLKRTTARSWPTSQLPAPREIANELLEQLAVARAHLTATR